MLKADNSAHIVKDTPTGITAYILYKEYDGGQALVKKADAETIVMERTKEDGTVVMSICTPDLGITKKGYTTSQTSQPLEKTVVLNGEWDIKCAADNISVVANGGNTVVKATCCHGQPVEFILKLKN